MSIKSGLRFKALEDKVALLEQEVEEMRERVAEAMEAATAAQLVSTRRQKKDVYGPVRVNNNG